MTDSDEAEDEQERRKKRRRRVNARARERRVRERAARSGRPGSNTLTILAILGVAVALIGQAFDFMDLAPRQMRGLVVGLLLAGAALLAARFVTPRAWAAIRERPALLLPLGLITGVEAVLAWFAAWSLVSAWLLETWSIWFVQLSLLFVGIALLRVLYASWATVLVVDSARGRSGTPESTFRTALSWFPRVLGIVFLCWATLMLTGALAIALGAAALPIALGFIAVITIVLNWLTVALLPVAVTVEGSFGSALSAGIRASRIGWRRWWKPVAVQMVLLGFITLVAVSYSGGGSSHTSTNWGINGFWVGGYEAETRWYSKYMEALKASPLPWMLTVLGLAFGALAVAVKLHVANELEDPDFGARAVAPSGGGAGGSQTRPRRPPPGIAVRRARRRRRMRNRSS